MAKIDTKVVIIIAALALVFAGGYYYSRHQSNDTVLDINLGGKKITATINHD